MEKKNNFKKLLPFVKPYIGLIILSIFFAILSTFGTIYLPIVIKDAIALFPNKIARMFSKKSQETEEAA